MLSKYERETIVIYNEEESTATVTTCSDKLRRQLARYSAESDECCLVENKDEYSKYSVPKKWIKVNMPRQYSEEQRKLMAERARNNLARSKKHEI